MLGCPSHFASHVETFGKSQTPASFIGQRLATLKDITTALLALRDTPRTSCRIRLDGRVVVVASVSPRLHVGPAAAALRHTVYFEWPPRRVKVIDLQNV